MAAAHRPITWLPIGDGALAIGGRPGKRSLPGLERAACDTILTLLSEEEGALEIREMAQDRGWAWRWLALKHAAPPPVDRDLEIRGELVEILATIRGGARLYLHCAAGLHRTGMIAAALLLLAGVPAAEVPARIRELRPLTADELRRERLAWAERIAAAG